MSKKFFEFTIMEVPVGPGEHSWVAVETKSGKEFRLPRGGNTIDGDNYVGRYPEIQDFLAEEYGVDASITYVPDIDDMTKNGDGKVRWTFRRSTAEVVVNDIPRTMFRVGTAS